MRKLLSAFALAAVLASAPGLVASAEAKHKHDRSCGHRTVARYDRGGSAWDVVQRDPCRFEEFHRFASKHENPVKRQRFVERLAREGCDRGRYAARYDDYSYGNAYPYGAPYPSDDVYAGGYGSPSYAYPPTAYGYGNGNGTDIIYPLIGLLLGR